MSQLISIADDVYASLSKVKGKKSYSEVIRELFSVSGNKAQVLSFFGKGDVDKEKIKQLHKDWKRWSEKFA